MNKQEIANKLSRTFYKAKFGLKKHSPEILVVTGVIGVVASAVLACKATTKLDGIMSEAKKEINIINKCIEHPEQVPGEYTKEDGKKDLRIVYAQTGLKLAKIYAPSIVLGAASITCILAGNNILHKRNVALAAAYTTVDNSFKDYRKRVVERFGEDLDKELKYNIKKMEVEEKVVDEKGKEKTIKKTVDIIDEPSEYAVFYDVGCNGWQKDAEHNKWFLMQQQVYANQKLKAQGYLFLNDVYDMLGVPLTKAGHVVGWIYDEKNPERDNYVDFGIFDASKPRNIDFVNGYERTILLDFNVDGPIIDQIKFW